MQEAHKTFLTKLLHFYILKLQFQYYIFKNVCNLDNVSYVTFLNHGVKISNPESILYPHIKLIL